MRGQGGPAFRPISSAPFPYSFGRVLQDRGKILAPQIPFPSIIPSLCLENALPVFHISTCLLVIQTFKLPLLLTAAWAKGVPFECDMGRRQEAHHAFGIFM